MFLTSFHRISSLGGTVVHWGVWRVEGKQVGHCQADQSRINVQSNSHSRQSILPYINECIEPDLIGYVGVLAVSRAIGDRHLKEYVIPDPDVMKWVCSSEDLFLVLATDGLWDVFTNNQVAKVLQSCDHPQKGAEMLARQAFSRGSTDNITVLVIDLRQKPTSGSDTNNGGSQSSVQADVSNAASSDPSHVSGLKTE